MQIHGTMLSALWFLLLHVSPLESLRFNLFRKKILSPQEGNVRLAGSEKSSEGRVELYHNGEWGTVCDDGWDLADAAVVCRQLHFQGALHVTAGGQFGEGSGPIWLDDTKCNGTENSLSNCFFKEWGITDCSHKEDAGVICVAHTDMTIDTIDKNSVDHSLELSEELGQLFDSQEGCDFLIHTHTYTGNRQKNGLLEMVNTTVCSHRMILSLFPGFKASTDMEEMSINLTETCQPHFTSFIRYVYTRKLDVTTTTAKCFHEMASHFGMKKLMEGTGRLFTRLLPEDGTFHTQVSFYEYSVEMGDQVLQENCLQYMAWNYQNLSTSLAWSLVSVELLEDLLSRSDLVVPSETFVLQSLEDWISKMSNQMTSKERQAALLGRIRFPMIPAEELFNLQLTSALYAAHRDLYRDKILKGFQANALPFSTLKNSSTFQDDDQDYRPRIYTGQPWSVVFNSSEVKRQGQYNRYSQSYFSTPVLNSAVFTGKKVQWEVNIFNTQYECRNSGMRCDSVPVTRMRDSTSQYQSSVRFSNQLLLSCQGRFICHIMDFKDNIAYVPFGKNLTYPCPNDEFIYHFVVRPGYI